jgi:tRNA-dihydrouridine synthase B
LQQSHKLKLYLAPLSGFTDSPFRRICKKFGADFVYSEMISSYGLVLDNKKTKNYLYYTDLEKPIIFQIFGGDAEVMRNATKKIKGEGIAYIDINFGCSVKKVLKQGAGAYLLKDKDRAIKIIKEVVKISPYPVSIKIRKGFEKNDDSGLYLSQKAEELGVKMICVHPRYAKQGFSGSADWDFIKKVKGKLKIKVVGNGDVKTQYDAKKMYELTACDGIAIGRAALTDPSIFKKIKNFFNGNPVRDLTLKEKVKIALSHLAEETKLKGEEKTLKYMRKNLYSYFKGLKNAKEIRKEINKITDYLHLKRFLESL